MTYLLIVSLLIVILHSFSQDGKIVEQTEYTNADSTIKNANDLFPT